GSAATAVAFSPNGKCLASGTEDGAVALWDIERGSLLWEPLKGHWGRVSSVAFSDDGRLLLSCSWDATLRIWDIACGKEL
ncbi:unnamed protein product, partial [Phaeothamnion confervicola]